MKSSDGEALLDSPRELPKPSSPFQPSSTRHYSPGRYTRTCPGVRGAFWSRGQRRAALTRIRPRATASCCSTSNDPSGYPQCNESVCATADDAAFTVVFSLGPGGAEAVMSLLAEERRRRGRDVTLITLDAAATDFHVNPRRTSIGSRLDLPEIQGACGLESRTTGDVFSRCGYRAARPDAIVSSFVDSTNLLVLVAAMGLGIPVIVSERTHPGEHDIGAVRSLMRRILYPLARAVVVQTEDARTWIAKCIPGTKLYVVPEPCLGLSDSPFNATNA